MPGTGEDVESTKTLSGFLSLQICTAEICHKLCKKTDEILFSLAPQNHLRYHHLFANFSNWSQGSF